MSHHQNDSSQNNASVNFIHAVAALTIRPVECQNQNTPKKINENFFHAYLKTIGMRRKVTTKKGDVGAFWV